MNVDFIMGLLMAGLPLAVLAISGHVEWNRCHRRLIGEIREHGKTIREWIRFSRQIDDHGTAIKCVMAAEAAAWRSLREGLCHDRSGNNEDEGGRD